MHHSKIANHMPQNCKLFLGLMKEAADLNLQYGRTTEALALFRQIGDAHLIAHCLLIHARTKLYIHSDGSVRYISNENEKVEIYLEEAIQLFKESNRHDNVQDLNTAMGEANLLLGRLSGDQKYIGFAFGKFQNSKPDRNEAGQLECLNWMINHSRLENELNLRKVILGMKNLFHVISILVTSHNDPEKRNRMEQILQNFGLHLKMNVVSYNPRHNPSILELLGKEKYPDILTKQDVRGEISLESARHAIIGYLLFKGQQWHHKIVTVLEKETTCLRKSDISQIAAKDLFRLIQLDVLYGRIEYFLDEGIQSVKGHLKEEERQVLDTYKHQISSFSQCRLLIDDVLCVIPHLRDNTKQMMELKTIFMYSARRFIEKYFKFRLSKLMNRSNKMRYQSIAYFVELITCHAIFALNNNIYADLAKLENTIGTECLMGETRRYDLRRMGFIPQERGKEHMIVLSNVRPFLYSILELTKFNDIFGALKEFKRFVCFMKGHEIQRTFSETTLLLHWLQYYIYVGFSLQSKCSHLRQLELEFIIPSTFLSSVKLVDSLMFRNLSTGTMIANFTSKTIPKYGEISGIVERCIEYLVGNIMKTVFKRLLECMPINETQTLLDITNEVETVMCLCMVFIINMGKIIFEKTETQILREIALINIPEDSPEKIVRLVKGIKSASGIADVYNHLLEVLKSKGEKLLKFKWDAKQKKISYQSNFISDLKNGFHLPDSIKTLSDPEKIPEQNIDESESEKVEFTADEIKSTEDDHEKIAQVVENTEQSHAANVERIHEKAHSDESLKDTFFPECLVNESRCDICGKTFQPDTVDLGEDDGSEYLSDSEQRDALSLPRSTIVPVRSLSSTSDEIKLSKDLEEHISSGLHKSNKEKYYRFKKYYHEKVKSGLEEVDQFIQEYQLDSPNVTKIYGNDDFRINAFVTSFKECKTRMVKLVKACQWTDRNTGEAIHKVTKQMEKLNASVKDAFRTHTQVSLNKLSV